VNVDCRHRSALGECVASFASTFPVAFLEAQFNKFNRYSILFGIAEEDIATHSLEAKGKRCLQGRRSHMIIGGGDIKEDRRSGGRKSPSGVQGRSPPEAEAFL